MVIDKPAQEVYSRDSKHFECYECGKAHTKQAFISHAKKDNLPAQQTASACCNAGVAPYLYEKIPNSSALGSPAGVIPEAVVESDLFILILGKAVSKAYWTQSWLGFEAGVSRGADIASYNQDYGPYMNKSYFYKRPIVFQDIRQSIKGSIPQLDVLVLLDFHSRSSWEQIGNLIAVMALQGDILKKGKEFRQHFLETFIECSNNSCKSKYDAWVSIGDVEKLGNRCKWIKTSRRYQWISKTRPIEAELTIECPSCDANLTRSFRQGL